MNIVLLSGGSGKRLWPLSNDTRAKQFIPIFQGPRGRESMVQRVYRQICAAIPDARVTVATSEEQTAVIRRQLGHETAVCVEPCRRDTFPAIALATAYLKDVLGVGEDEAVVVCPVDPYVEQDYFSCLGRLWKLAQAGTARLMLLGIQPTYPSEKYGYIQPAGPEEISAVTAFREKPDAGAAAEYIKKGALWNGGVFAYKVSYMLERAGAALGASGYEELLNRYDRLPKISFDYAVAERETDVAVLRFRGQWKDIGTWNTLIEAMDSPCAGPGMLGECENTHIVNELSVPILALGMENTVIAASEKGILVCDKNRSAGIKPYLDEMESRPWMGDSAAALDEEEMSRTVKIRLLPGQERSWDGKDARIVAWTVTGGKGMAWMEGREWPIGLGAQISAAAGGPAVIRAQTEMTLIEVRILKQ